ncbi:MAG TPA: tetratricopeptide repeat protein [Acidimicrobiales bacterium]|nr:tetratricopeptide repeat protein [Acidimicrobiales bacterium]
MSTTMLDGDALARLEEERDHLLRSLDDLEREHDAGDVDDHDYASLRDDYTARAAAVIRALGQQSVAAPAELAAPTPWARRLAWVAVVGLFALVAGVLMARASGSRRGGDTATGDIPLATRQLLVDAQSAAVGNDYTKAIELYTKVLDIQPSNVEALTYRGWSKVRNGDLDGAKTDLEAAVDQDKTYPDARVFRAVIAVENQQFDAAAQDLAAFDALDPPDLMKQIVTAQRLRERILAGQVSAKLLVVNPPSLAASGFTATQVRSAAEETAEEARLTDALKLFEIVLAADPRDARAHTYKGWALARAGVDAKQQQLIDAAMTSFDRALQVDPKYPDAHVFRAFTLFYGLNRAADAKAELATFDALADRPADLVKLIDDNGLRAAIDAKLKGG